MIYCYCDRCGRKLAPAQTVYRFRGRTDDLLGSQYDRRLTMCADCFKKSWYAKSPDYVSEPRPCKGCGRTVIDCFSYWESTYCSEHCRLDYYREQAREKRELARGKRICANCGQSFMPKRTDSRYCSAACKQKAYRQRNSPSY
jgi:hypothetical protein